MSQTQQKSEAAAEKAEKPLKQVVGDVVEVKSGTALTRPDGSSHVSYGGRYVLDVPGLHVVGEISYDVEA